MKYVRHHFIPQFILRNFSKEKDSDGDELINVYNNFTIEVDKIKISNAYMVRNLYESTQFEDIRQLEMDFGKYLENKVAPIIKRLVNSNKEFVINRTELKLIKKYLLITIYRTETNMSYYLRQNINGKPELSDLLIREGESKLDFWKREMYTIVHKDWDFLSNEKCDIESVRLFASEINQSHLCIFESENEEFIMNDLGKVSELILFQITKENEKYLRQAANFISKNYINKPNKAKELFANVLDNKTMKFETFMFFPVSPKKAIVVAKKSNNGGFELRHYEKSITLNSRRFSPPTNEYVNSEVYLIKKQIQENAMKVNENNNYIKVLKKLNSLYDSEDKFIYSIQ